MPENESVPVPLSKNASPGQASRWVRRCVRFVGAGFHPDTPFSQYVRPDGSASFTNAESQILEIGLERAWTILENAGIEIYAVALAVQRRILTSMGMNQ